jgi:ribosomal protein L12E/L44/L45/RPP1/RPP2
MNFKCVFQDCGLKFNNITENVFRQHLDEVHSDELIENAKRESISIETMKMMTISNSKVFINS